MRTSLKTETVNRSPHLNPTAEPEPRLIAIAKQSVRRLFDETNQRCVEGILSQMADNYVGYFPFEATELAHTDPEQPVVSGKAQVKKHWEDNFAAGNWAVSIDKDSSGKDRLYRFEGASNKVVAFSTMQTPMGTLSGPIVFSVDPSGKLDSGELLLQPQPQNPAGAK